MPIFHRTAICNPVFEIANAAPEDIHCAFVLQMPFRFRVKTPYRCHFVNRGRGYDVWIKNASIQPSDSGSAFHSLMQAGLTIDDLWSKIAIIPNDSCASEAEIAALRKCDANALIEPFASIRDQIGNAVLAMNAFIFGYHNATGEHFGGRPIRPLTFDDFISCLAWEVSLVGFPLSHWTDDTICELFELKADVHVQGGVTLHGDVFDLPSQKLDGIPESIDRLNSFYFYELAFEAKSKMFSSDLIGALLLAVAALEGVHGAFVTSILESILPAGRKGEDKNLEELFLKELGFSLCNRLTPFLFMAPADRPESSVIQNATTAVKYRNEIMHALRNAAGQYRIRLRSDADLQEAYGATLKLYDVYRKALEKSLVKTGSRSEL